MKPIYLHYSGYGGYIPRNSSHLFGSPALPKGCPWPQQPNIRYGRMTPYVSSWDGNTVKESETKNMTFVGQINFTDLPANTLLPRSGLLMFFANIEYYDNQTSGGEPVISMHVSEPDSVKVLYVPETDMESDVQIYQPAAIHLSFNHTRPTIEEDELQMFGSSEHLEWEDWPEPCEGWTLLLQVDSIEYKRHRYNFVDFGVLCFLINPEALRRLDFSDVRAIILST